MSTPTIIRGVIPILPVADMREAVAFYQDKLGFKTLFQYGDPPMYAGLQRGPIEIHLCPVDDISIAHQTQIRILVANIEPLYHEYQAAEVIHPNGRLQTKPWGTREFSVLDLNGVCITVYEAGK